MSEPVNGASERSEASVAKRSAAERVSGVSGASERMSLTRNAPKNDVNEVSVW